ncbi:MAG: xanthine dehydrogenase family protein subunit M [Candidatus Poribacteria bacterium]|nr:xanthine dehydrogenase family protein subunit M [Candidatus Poribacteria bacterium]
MQAFDYVAAKSLSEAVNLLTKYRDQARILSGGTDLIVQVRENHRQVGMMVDIKGVPEVNTLSYNGSLEIGASVPCYKIYSNEAIKSNFPALVDATSIIGGVQIQSRASVGGNLCNASPAADSIPALIILGAQCVIDGPDGERSVAVEDFCDGPGQTALESNELLVKLVIPTPTPNASSFYLRFTPRNEMDIAVVGAGAAVELSADHQTFVSARIALGAVAPTPLFADDAGSLLAGKPVSDESIEEACEAAKDIATPISDMRGTAAQRTHLVGVLTRRALNGAVNRIKERS